MNIIHLPPDYSEADRRRKAELLEMLRELHEEMLRRAKPIQDALVDIENRYAPKAMIIS